MTTSELLLAVVVEMPAGRTGPALEYEDRVLALLGRHGGTLERRMRSTDDTTEVHVIRFAARAGLRAYLADPDRGALRAEFADAVPTARVLEVRDV